MFVQNFLQELQPYLSDQEIVLLRNMVWGGSEGLSGEQTEAFHKLGIEHILSASGFNIQLVSGLVPRNSQWLSDKVRLILSCGVITAYSFLANWPVPIQRAVIMFMLSEIGSVVLRRQIDAGRLLLASCVGLMLTDSHIVESISFQLSVAATAALIWISPALNRLMGGSSKRTNWEQPFGLNIKENLMHSISILMMVSPITIWHFHELNTWSWWGNVSLVWITPGLTSLALTQGLLLKIVSISESLTRLFSLISWPILAIPSSLFIWGVVLTAQVIPEPITGLEISGSVVFVWYVGLFLLTMYSRRHTRQQPEYLTLYTRGIPR